MHTYRTGQQTSFLDGGNSRALQCESCRQYIDCMVDCMTGFARLSSDEVIFCFPESWKSIKDQEVRRNLSLFVRSRWFKPPLSGPRMSELMYDGIIAMGEPRRVEASLLPSRRWYDVS